MSMSKDEEIDLLLFQDIKTVTDQPFPVRTEEFVIGMSRQGTASSAEVIRHTNPNGWRYQTEKPSTNWITEYFLQKLITMVSRSKPVAMSDMKVKTVEPVVTWRIKDGDVQFIFEIAAHPHVVIPDKKMNGDSTVRDISQFTKDANIPFWNNLSIFKPEIKHVPEDQDQGSIGSCGLQEANDFPLPFEAVLPVWGSEVKIG